MREIVFNDKKYEVTNEHFDYLFCKQSQGYVWKDENGTLVAVERVPSEEEIKANRIKELKSLLAKYDYIGVKIATGCATIEDYAKEIAQCKAWREEINRLESELNGTI